MADVTGLMEGFPPPADKIIRFQDHSYYQYPQFKWSFANIQQLMPTKTVWRGPGAAHELKTRDIGIDKLEFTSEDGDALSWAKAHELAETQAIGVLHRGELVAEEYWGYMGPHKQYTIHSCGKSITGLLTEMLIEDGVLDETALIPEYLPELADTAWTDATVRDLLDMLIDMEFYENYLDPESDVWRMLRAAGQLPQDPTKEQIGFTDYVLDVKSAGPSGKAFVYREPNIFVLRWLVCRVSGMHENELLSERIWQHAGGEHDVQAIVDPNGFSSSQLFTLRDYLRLGEMVQTGGNGVFSEKVRASVFRGGDQSKFSHGGYENRTGWSYRSQFWMREHEGRQIAMMRGAHGQFLYMDPAKELVIARFGAHERAPGSETLNILLPLFDAITKAAAG